MATSRPTTDYKDYAMRKRDYDKGETIKDRREISRLRRQLEKIKAGGARLWRLERILLLTARIEKYENQSE